MNRYLLSDYSAAEIAALTDEPLLWWLVWQALGHEVLARVEHSSIFDSFVWYHDDTKPRCISSVHSGRPSLEAVLDALAEHPTAARLNFREKCVEDEMTCRLEGSPAPDNYTSACRALLAWKRGQP